MENLRGIAFMVAAMAGFALEDTAIKLAGTDLPLGPLVTLFGLGGLVIFGTITLMSGQTLVTPDTWSRPIAVRAACEVTGRAGYFLGITLTPLSNASTILQATPLVVVLGAAAIFGERVGWRRWTAIGIGLLGVLIVLRPGLDGFRMASLFTVVGMAGLAGRDLATRAAPKSLSNLQLAVYGFAMLVPTGLGLSVFTGFTLPHTTFQWALVGGAIIFGTLAYYSITAAMRIGDVAVVTPFRYTRLLFALALGVAVFGERVDTPTIVGATLVIAAGLYTIAREARIRGGR
jgi:drug/metabolite transporter (DMT)-like permease